MPYFKLNPNDLGRRQVVGLSILMCIYGYYNASTLYVNQTVDCLSPKYVKGYPWHEHPHYLFMTLDRITVANAAWKALRQGDLDERYEIDWTVTIPNAHKSTARAVDKAVAVTFSKWAKQLRWIKRRPRVLWSY